MWRLPKLVWKAAEWQLPLADDSAGHLVLALLADDATCRARLSQTIQADPAICLWSLCNSDNWQTAPPARPEVLADWFLDEGVDRLSGEAQIIGKPVEPAASVLPLTTHDSIELLRACGSPVTADDLRDCPWFPKWLLDGRPLPFAANGQLVVGNIGVLLPQVVQQRQRLRLLETRFAQTLEQEKLAALKELAYGASHEINNPLANIATRAQTMLRDEPDPERKRKLATIAAQAFRAHEMIADMMLFAKPPLPQRRPTDVVAILRIVLAECAADAAAQETTITMEASPAAIKLEIDPTQLVVALKALVRNALEALGAGGSILIDATKKLPRADGAESVDISVRDNGPGIGPEVRRHLFDPFYSGREAGRGLGFGLAKCWRIAELHGGTISVDSNVGDGATFTLHLPVTRL